MNRAAIAVSAGRVSDGAGFAAASFGCAGAAGPGTGSGPPRVCAGAAEAESAEPGSPSVSPTVDAGSGPVAFAPPSRGARPRSRRGAQGVGGHREGDVFLGVAQESRAGHLDDQPFENIHPPRGGAQGGQQHRRDRQTEQPAAGACARGGRRSDAAKRTAGHSPHPEGHQNQQDRGAEDGERCGARPGDRVGVPDAAEPGEAAERAEARFGAGGEGGDTGGVRGFESRTGGDRGDEPGRGGGREQ